MKNIDNQVYQGQRNTAPYEKNKKRGIDMINNNNEFYQNSMINARKDNDEWKNAAGTCSPELIKKNITENGTYNASDDGADGYSSVKVDVSGGGGETFEVNISVNLVDDIGIVSDKTYSEMLDAYNANKKVIGTLTFITDLTEEYDIIGWDKNNLNGNNSLYIFTSVLGEGRQTQSIVLGFLETGYYIGIASGDVIPIA